MADAGITIETRFDVAADRIDELLDGLTALLHRCGGEKGTGVGAEARVTLQLFPSLPRGVPGRVAKTDCC